MSRRDGFQASGKSNAALSARRLIADYRGAAPAQVAGGCPENVEKRTSRLSEKLRQQQLAVVAGVSGVCEMRPFHVPILDLEPARDPERSVSDFRTERPCDA